MAIDFKGYTGRAMVRGDLLPPRLQQCALGSYLHRFTKEHRPLWANKPRDDGTPYPVQFATDKEWLSRTLFPVTIRKGGRLGDHTKGHARSFATWPDGLSKADMATPSAQVIEHVPLWERGQI